MSLGYLLDTHVLLWFVQESRELGKQTRHILTNGSLLAYSPLSIFELDVKRQLGRITFETTLQSGLKSQNVDEIPFTVDHALGVSRFDSLIRHDPFDRMLLAQSSYERLDFLTADRALLALNLPWILDARS